MNFFTFPKSANFECYYGTDFPHKSIQTFGYSFEPKGNFTFSWESAIAESDNSFLCGPYYLIMKEFTRRTQYNAIPIFVNGARSTNPELSNLKDGQFIEYLWSKQIDILMRNALVTDKMLDRGRPSVPASFISPLISILSARHPSTETDNYFAIATIFDIWVWISIGFSFILLSAITATFKWITTTQKLWINSWLNEMALFIRLIIYGNLKLPFSKHWVHTIYGMILLTSIILLHCFSGSILSHTIQKGYTPIDDLEKLFARPDIRPLVIYDERELNQIKKWGGPLLLKLLDERSDKMIEGNIIGVAVKSYDLRQKLNTHSIVTTPHNNYFLKAEDRRLHIGSQKYFEVYRGFYHDKNLNNLLFNELEKLFYNMIEGDLWHKWVIEALDFGWRFVTQGQNNHVEHNMNVQFSLSNMKIAIGPLYLLFFLSLVALISEILHKVYN